MTSMGARTLLGLFMVGLLVQAATTSSSWSKTNDNKVKGQDFQAQNQPQPFCSGNEYIFEYNSQLASGLIGPNNNGQKSNEPQYNDNDYDDENQNGEKSMTRLQAKAKITFITESRATLELVQPRVGQLSGATLNDAKRVQPMGMFQSTSMDEQKRKQLELPLDFHYADGVVERINFHAQDSAWSKNVKRAVLNLIQLNLKRKAEPQQQQQQQQQQKLQKWSSSSEEINNENDAQMSQWNSAKTFVVPEVNILP